jgi:hypothetical protein
VLSSHSVCAAAHLADGLSVAGRTVWQMHEVRGGDRIDAALDELAGCASAQSRLFALTCRRLVQAQQGAREVDERLEHRLTTEFLPFHVAGTLTLRQGTAQARLEQARHLVVQLPSTWQALDDGWLRVHAATVLVQETLALTPAQCARVEDEVLPWAPSAPPVSSAAASAAA